MQVVVRRIPGVSSFPLPFLQCEVILANEERFEGSVEGPGNILSVKNRPSVRLPMSRPSFPCNIAQGALPKPNKGL